MGPTGQGYYANVQTLHLKFCHVHIVNGYDGWGTRVTANCLDGGELIENVSDWRTGDGRGVPAKGF